MQLDGDRIRQQRAHKGLTQQQLALKSGWNARTIQRAERGEPIQNRAAAEIAQALEVRLDALKARQPALFDVNAIAERRADEVVLLRCDSGRRLVSDLRSSTFASIEHDVEPREDNLDALKAFGTIFDRCWDDPFAAPHDRLPAYSETELIEVMAAANKVIGELATMGIGIFSGTYTIEHPAIRYGEFGEPYWRSDRSDMTTYQKTLLVLSDQPDEVLYRRPGDLFVLSFDSNEVPF